MSSAPILGTEVKLEIYDSSGQTLVGTFGMDRLVTMSTIPGLLSEDKPGAGGAVAAEIDVAFLPWNSQEQDVTIPRMAMLRPYVRDLSASAVSWRQKGEFWIDTRSADKQTGVLKLQGFDAMLKGEVLFCADGVVAEWPRTDIQVLNGFTKNGVFYPGIAQKMGVTISQASLALINKGYAVQFPGTVQTDGMTESSVEAAAMSVRECLGAIMAMYGLNAAMNDAGEMIFVPLKNSATPLISGLLAASVDVVPQQQAYDGVEIVVDSETSYLYPTSGNIQNRLVVNCIWGTSQMALNLYSAVSGYAYQPFTADGAILPIDAQVGDRVTVEAITGCICSLTWNFSGYTTAKISAPQSRQIDHEYPFMSSAERAVERALANTQASLVVMANEIVSKVSSAEAQSMIDQKAVQILASVSDNYYGKYSSVDINIDGIDIGTSGGISMAAGSTFTVSSGNFSIDSSGNVHIAGTLDAAYINARNVITSGQALGSASGILSSLWVQTLQNTAKINTPKVHLNVPDSLQTAVDLTPSGVTIGSNPTVSWSTIISGGSGAEAVFG